MKCIVIYFSQTGNTEKVAKAIQAGVKQTAGHCDIVKIKEANPRRLYEYDLIGLGTPVIDFVEPRNVRAFINDMRFVGGKHVFAFGTHGTHPEHFFPSMVPKLKRRGLTVIGMRSWYGSCYVSIEAKPYPTDGHPDEIDLKEAEDFGREMVERSWRIAAGETELIPPVPPKPPPLPEALGLDGFPNSFKSMLKFHKEKCRYPKCRLCMDNCPMDGIDLSVKPPVMAKPCLGCAFCAKICPTGAIDGDAWAETMAPKVAKLMPVFKLPHLEEAEREGRFRRLVPVEDIGYDTPVYKVYNKHPQWVIGKGLQ
jgi:flavodoxin/NAD-dependent dihydropyrimidine dehydrogenase PreA subunit